VIYFLDNTDFWNEENNYAFLRNYIADTLKYNSLEIEYLKKYSPMVYHENTYISLEFEDELWEQVLNKLKEQL